MAATILILSLRNSVGFSRFAIIFDAPATLKSLFTLSIWQRPWDAGGEIPYEEVGYFEADLFDPQAWKPNFPNLAFLASDGMQGFHTGMRTIIHSSEVRTRRKPACRCGAVDAT